VPRFNFSGRALPVTLRVARSLVLIQACLLLLSAAFVMLIALVLGAGNSVPFAGASLSGGSAAALAVFYAALGAISFYLAIDLTRMAAWTRNALIGLEAVLIIMFMARGDLSISLVVSVLLCLAVAALLVTSSASTAFSGGAATTTTEAAAPRQPS
jgi:hypothetical protein